MINVQINANRLLISQNNITFQNNKLDMTQYMACVCVLTMMIE